MGDDKNYSYLQTPYGNTLSDRVAKHVLEHHTNSFQTYSFLERGSDERQYCAPNIELPIASIMRSKYGTFPEYHTSLDNLDFISQKGLEGSLNIYQKCIEVLENNKVYKSKCLGEPQLGKRGLYPDLSTKGSGLQVRMMTNCLAYMNGKIDLLEIAERIKVSAFDLLPIIKTLKEYNLVEQ